MHPGPETPPILRNRLAEFLSDPRVLAILGTLALFGLPLLYTSQPLFIHTSIKGAPVNPKSLETDVRYLSESSIPRDFLHPKRLDETARWIKGRMEETGATVSEQVFAVKGRVYRNVVGRFGPASGGLVVVGAHYDVCGPNPGADDNASGVAGLLALATLLGREPPPVPVELVAYTLEEPPFFRTEHMGSVHHAKSLAKGQVRAMVCLEMIGTFSDEPGSQHYPLPGLEFIYPNRGDYIAVIGGIGDAILVRKVKAAMGSATPLPVWSMNAPSSLTGIDFSDHASYWKEGIPAVMITDSAFYRNHHYHTVQDTADSLDYVRMAQVVEGVHEAVRAFGR